MESDKINTPSSTKSNINRLQSLPTFKKKITRSNIDTSESRSRFKGPLTPTNSQKKELDMLITPEVAAIVVRQYLLPMFESDTKQKNSILTSLSEELHRPLEAIAGTVYGELKLADSLMSQLTQAREEIEKVSQSLKFAEQERQSVYAELENIKKNYSNISSGIESVHAEFQDTLKTQQNTDWKVSFTSNQLSEYKRMYNECETENKFLNSALHEEKALNDKRKNTATELEHGNEILKMENDIMAERLGGLYEELDKLPGRKYVEEKLEQEIEVLIISLKNLTVFCNELGSNLVSSISKRDELKSQYHEIEQLTDEIKVQRDKLAATSKEHIEKLKKELSTTVEQREDYKTKLSKIEKNYKDLTESYDKMRQKLKQWKQKGKQYGLNEEKTCMKCRKTFTETENYNWSCKVHTGAYSGEMYWCCGKKGKDATGCQSSKHVGKEEDEKDGFGPNEDDKLKYASIKCSSCKEIGHKAHECPKDPNIQGGNDPEEDIKRIEEIKNRKKANAMNIVVNQKLMDVMALRFPGEAFGMREVSSDSERYYEDEIPENYVHEPFKDIKALQSLGISNSSNLIPVENFTLKEEKNKSRSESKKPTHPYLSIETRK
jgi:uncharacterized coiled-coil DUF342 family protein